MIHCLKVWPEYFKTIVSGEKNFEVRKDDRNFQVGDVLVLQEFDLDKTIYTGRMVSRIVTYKLPGGIFGVKEGFCVLALRELEK